MTVPPGELYKRKAFSRVEVWRWTAELEADPDRWPDFVRKESQVRYPGEPENPGKEPINIEMIVARHSPQFTSRLSPGCVLVRCLETGLNMVFFEEEYFLEDFEPERL